MCKEKAPGLTAGSGRLEGMAKENRLHVAHGEGKQALSLGWVHGADKHTSLFVCKHTSLPSLLLGLLCWVALVCL